MAPVLSRPDVAPTSEPLLPRQRLRHRNSTGCESLSWLHHLFLPTHEHFGENEIEFWESVLQVATRDPAGKAVFHSVRRLWGLEVLGTYLFFCLGCMQWNQVIAGLTVLWALLASRAQVFIALGFWRQTNHVTPPAGPLAVDIFQATLMIHPMRKTPAKLFGKELPMSELMFAFLSNTTSALTPWFSAAVIGHAICRWSDDRSILRPRWEAGWQEYPFVGSMGFPLVLGIVTLIGWTASVARVATFTTEGRAWRTQTLLTSVLVPMADTANFLFLGDLFARQAALVDRGIPVAGNFLIGRDTLIRCIRQLCRRKSDARQDEELDGREQEIEAAFQRRSSSSLEAGIQTDSFGGPAAVETSSLKAKKAIEDIARNERSRLYCFRTILQMGPVLYLKVSWLMLLGLQAAWAEWLLAMVAILTSLYTLGVHSVDNWHLIRALWTLKHCPSLTLDFIGGRLSASDVMLQNAICWALFKQGFWLVFGILLTFVSIWRLVNYSTCDSRIFNVFSGCVI